MLSNKLKTSMVVGLLLLLLSSPLIARAEESDLKPEPKYDTSTVKRLDDEVDDSSLGNEVDSLDNESYRFAARQSKLEEKKLKAQLVELQRQKKATMDERERLKADSDLATKNLAAQVQKNEAAKRELEQARKEKMAEDQKNQQIRENLKTVEARERELKLEQYKIDFAIRFVKQERAEIIEKINTMQVNQTRLQQKQQEQNAKIVQYRKQTKTLEASIAATPGGEGPNRAPGSN